jgi:glycosyltransferase involved in cell wall biosynthesis
MKVILFRDYKEENWHSMDVYADQLASNLRRLQTPRFDIDEYVALPNVSKYFSSIHKYIRIGFRYVVNPLGAVFQRADIYHITDHANSHLIRILDPKRVIVTCHDLTAPYWMMKHAKLTLKKRIRFSVERWRLGYMKQAARIIAVSEATKRDIIQTLHIPPDRIVVIPEGVNDTFRPVKDRHIYAKTSVRLHLPKKYILHVGTTYYNKNIEGLVRMFTALARNDPDLWLVKSGDPWTEEQKIIIQKTGFSDRVLHLGFVATKDLPYVYSGAIALLQPSYAEGFGFTVLEAMACGCPVIVSDIPALHEMAGDAGLFISPTGSSSDVSAIAQIIRSPKTRNHMAMKGLDLAARYSWGKTAKMTQAIYIDVISQSAQTL